MVKIDSQFTSQLRFAEMENQNQDQIDLIVVGKLRFDGKNDYDFTKINKFGKQKLSIALIKRPYLFPKVCYLIYPN